MKISGLKFIAPMIWLAIVTAVTFFLVDNREDVKVETNILKLLPKAEADPMLEIAFDKFASQNMQQLIFLVESKQQSKALTAARELLSTIRETGLIEQIETQFDVGQQKAIAEYLFKYRHLLLSSADRTILQQKQYDDFTADNLELIFSPIAGGLASLITNDPYLLSYRFSQSLNNQSKLTLLDGLLTTEIGDAHYVLIVASLASSPFSQTTQNALMTRLQQLEQGWQAKELPVQLLTTGAMFYAAEAFKTAEQEISTIGLTSLVLVILLIVISFKSLMPLLLTSIALCSGIASGLAVILAVFGEIHLITLVFGASLIGVAVDYSFHYFVVSKSITARQRVLKILPAISLGLLSSVVGYLSLLTTPFPGLNQMALFCIVGLTIAYLTVTLLFPVFPQGAEASTPLLNICRKLLDKISTFPVIKVWRVLWILPVAGFIVATFQTVSQDNIRQFQTTSIKLQQDEKKIKSVLELEASNQFFLAYADTSEQLLTLLESAQTKLEGFVNNGIIDGFENLSQRLPSQAQQSQNYQIIADLYYSDAKHQLLELGVITEQQYQDAIDGFKGHQSLRLSPEEWLASDMARPFRNLWLGQVEDVFVAIIPIIGINDLAALSDINSNVVFVDKVNKVTQVFSDYRIQTSRLLVLALLLITLMLAVRYGLSKAITIVSAPLFSISITVLVLFMLNVNLTLFNTLALFLIIGIGIDYGLFFAESKQLSERTFLAIFLSALTTIFSFGLLALSQTVAIQAFGLTMLVGITSSFILSPIIGSLVLKKLGN